MEKIADKIKSKKFFQSIRKMKPDSSISEYYNDKDNLIDVSTSTALDKGFYFKKEGKVVYPNLDLELLTLIIDLVKQNTCKVQVKIDHVGDYSRYINLNLALEDRVFGLPFTLDNLKEIHNKKFGTYEYHIESRSEEIKYKNFCYPLKRLEYSIKPYDKENLTLSVEAIIDFDKTDYNQYSSYVDNSTDNLYIINNYFHAIFDRKSFKIKHFDLSLLYYSFDAYCERINKHLKDKPVSATFKVKKFRIDGEIEFKTFSQIFATGMDGKTNPEITKFILGK